MSDKLITMSKFSYHALHSFLICESISESIEMILDSPWDDEHRFEVANLSGDDLHEAAINVLSDREAGLFSDKAHGYVSEFDLIEIMRGVQFAIIMNRY